MKRTFTGSSLEEPQDNYLLENEAKEPELKKGKTAAYPVGQFSMSYFRPKNNQVPTNAQEKNVEEEKNKNNWTPPSYTFS